MDERRVVAAQPLAPWTPARDVLPPLPLGTPVFHSLPGRAIVLEALAPAVNDGIVVSRLGESAGVMLIRGGSIAECFCIDGGVTLTGEEALRRISRWDDASVSAAQLSVAEANLIPPLFRGDPLYDDLRLKWVSWTGLLADLRQRPGAFVVELSTPAGRGVTSIREGTHVASYTDQHPGLGDPTMLDELAQSGAGTIRVLHEDAPSTVLPVSEAEAAASGPVVALDTALPRAPEPAADQASSFNELFGVRQQPAAAPAPAPAPGPTETPAPVAEPATEAAYTTAPDFTELLADLKLLVRSRLQMSSPRVEILLEDAVSAGRPLEWVAVQVRGMAIRGVQQSTLERLADDMLALAGQRAR